MGLARVRVRRERPRALAWAVALALTMLAVYLITLPRSEAPDSLFASATVTRALTLPPVDAWCVSLARCDTPEEARVRAAALTDRGAAGVAARWDGAWLALAAAYDSQREAERVAGRIREEAGAPAEVVRLTAPAVGFNVTAPEAQLDDLSAADELLRSEADRLGALARQLDRGEVSAEAARTLCAVAAGEARGRLRALKRWPGADEDALCGALVHRLDVLAGLLDAAATAAPCPAATLSAHLRAAQLETLTATAIWQREQG